ncbi:MAG: M1 family aminopeptidase [Desulfobacterales bacterium]
MCGLATLANALSVEHNLEVELFPAEHKLIGLDSLEINTGRDESLVFHLSEKAEHISVMINGEHRDFNRQKGWLHVPLKTVEQTSSLQVTIHYAAVFDDPVPLRPLNVDNPGFGVSASITEKGSFLLAGSHWYPELNGGQAVYQLQVRAPEGMIAVTAGQSLGHDAEDGKTVSRWQANYPIEGMSLSVAPYVVREKKAGDVTAATYFLPPNQHLSAAYLAATVDYLSFYSNLFGPYPFKKFAVVENFFPTGYGFPSYTLLGGSVLRLPFIIHTSLGHEIAHCWWGNGVYVDYDSGNWSEALTTYVSDYLYKEKRSNMEAKSYRQQILRNYATLVTPDNDFALNHFVSRHDPVTKTIGYDKGAMVFHMLRKLTGEKAFWQALRDIYKEQRFKQTSWKDLQQAFEKQSTHSLQAFFEQWVFQKGAPRFYLDGVNVEPLVDKWRIRGNIVQQKPYYAFPLTLTLETSGQMIVKHLNIAADRATAFEMESQMPPQKVIVDPEVNIMRRLFDTEVPPAINSLKGSPSVMFLVSDTADAELANSAKLLALSLGLKKYEIVSAENSNQTQLRENDLVVIGHPLQKTLLRNMPPQFAVDHRSFVLNNSVYNQSSDVFFGVCRHPFDSHRVAALFLPLSSDYAELAARKITHYGKYSYLVFKNGKNQDKGFWQVKDSPLVYSWKDNDI